MVWSSESLPPLSLAGRRKSRHDDPSRVASPVLTRRGVAAGRRFDFFEQRIRPILVEKCQSCHGPEKQKGGLRLDTKEAWRRGGGRGPAVVPGEVEQSPLIGAVHREDDLAMPPSDSAKLNDREVADLVEWVRRGAPDPREGVAQIGGMTRDEA